jgi:hypothetical protein
VILEAILGTLFTAVVGALEGILPASDAADTSWDLTGAIHLYGWLNSWAPVAETIEMLVLTVEVLVVLGAVWAITWVLQRLHIIGGSS